ncbi:MAG: (d)CMP kinase [Chloroflexi bacterium]|nr:(d)CMP kinase [Chloroflexota bacterium]MYA51305.1 (d)CMP kinase [Chloroflexota bacterium]MYF64917.1 (d)CMP kinase [Chloroflexota bacterium]MYK33716.1 (d)CMP kinase [Chloroflexota bacterium]
MLYPSVIAIDGPVASGKTTVGRELARRLGYAFVDTGVYYRAITIAALDTATPLDDEAALSRLAEAMAVRIGDGGLSVLVDDVDVTSRLRAPEVDAAVSPVAKVGGVRRAMVAQQRATAEGGDVVMVGRDIGTHVLPDAAKVYLDASPEERARRRSKELAETAQARSEDEVLGNLRMRDAIDSGREDSPLRVADDALHIVTDGLEVADVVELLLGALGTKEAE